MDQSSLSVLPISQGQLGVNELLSDIIAVQQEIATADAEPQTLMMLIASRAQLLTQSDGAAIQIADGEEMVYRAATGTAASSVGLRLQRDSSLSGLAADTGEILLCDDSETDSRVDREACRRVGVRSMIVVPLRTGSTVVGVLKVLSNRTYAYNEHSVHILQLMTGLLAAALANARAFDAERALAAERERALKLSEGRFDAFMNNSPVVAFAKDAAGHYSYVNQAFRRHFRARRGDVIGSRGGDIWSLPVAERLEELDRAVFTQDLPVSSEEPIPNSDGSIRHWLMNLFQFKDGEHGSAVGGLAIDITDRKEATRSRDDTLALLDSLLNSAPHGIAFLDADLRYVRVNPMIEELHGLPEVDHIGQTFQELGSPFASEMQSACRYVLETGNVLHDLEFSGMVGTPAKLRHLNASFYPVPTPDGRRGVGQVLSDVTEKKALADKLRHSQKMDAVGQLAGGVAHDFNNLLTVINGYSDILLEKFSEDESIRQMVQEIRKSGDRAASLTHQLLAYSRRQVLEPKVINLNRLLTEVERLLTRLIGEDVLLAVVTAPNLRPVLVDPGQFEQLLLNLAVNARDAMPTGGRLTIATGNADVGQEYRTVPDARPGEYVLMAVSDTGCGMTPEIQANIFEPFFTTKGPGKGTGLGLATVQGIVKQSGGFVTVLSKPGSGTTFNVYLPAVNDSLTRTPEPAISPDADVGNETVLVTEDDEPVRRVIRLALRSFGYTVLEAENGEQALRMSASHSGAIHLLVTDVIMPGMGGSQLVERICAIRPDIQVLYLSGYTDDAVVRHGVFEARVNFLQKPFSPNQLAIKVREALDRRVV